MKFTLIAAYFAFTDFLTDYVLADCNSEKQFICTDGTCIALNDVCDEIQQCPDGSDEKDCEFREQDANYEGLHRQENMRLNQWENEWKTSAGLTKHLRVHKELLYKNHKWTAAIAVIIIVLGALVIWLRLQHKRVRKPRSLRSSDVVDEDEDDLLISSMYAT